MGLKKLQEINNTGTFGDYHRISNFYVDANKLTGITVFGVYASKEARDEGKSPLDGIRDEFNLIEVISQQFETPIIINNGLDAINLVKQILYNVAKSHSEYNTAEDVIETVIPVEEPVIPEVNPDIVINENI